MAQLIIRVLVLPCPFLRVIYYGRWFYQHIYKTPDLCVTRTSNRSYKEDISDLAA
jgi:hypothetical protein